MRRGYIRNRFEVDARAYAAARLARVERVQRREDVNVVKHTATSVVTIERFIIEEERNHPEATGELSGILYDLALAAKMIANKVRSAGLADILGATDTENVQGEVQQKLDILANEIIVKAMDHGGRLCAMASEEEPGIIQIPEPFKCGKYCLLFDPLDGSSNIDVNVPVGTIFSVVRKITRGRQGELEDMLQPGRRQVAAGYVIYGSSTMLVYTTGQGVHGFTLDPSIGEFLLSHPNIRIPDSGRYLSVNDSYEQLWDEKRAQGHAARIAGLEGDRQARSARATSARSSRTSTATCSAAASSRIRRTRSRRRGSCACCTKRTRSRSSWSRRAARRRDGVAAHSRRRRRRSCTSARRSTSAARAEVEFARRALAPSAELVSA